MTTIRPRRSVLYMPGSNARALEKARTLPADALIFDLEDAVAPEAKEAARRQALAAVRAGGYGHRELAIRINGLGTPWGADDIAAAAGAGAHALLIPKVRSAQDVAALRRALDAAGAPDRLALWAMMETPLSVLNAAEIAAAGATERHPLTVLVMGTNDLAKETGAALSGARAGLLAWLSACVLAARAHGLDIVDGVYNALADDAGFRAECRQGRQLGMDGKTLIHPGQITPCNDIFSPSAEDIAWAETVIAAFALPENQGKGAISVEGRMVERMHADIARRTVAIAGAIRAQTQN